MANITRIERQSGVVYKVLVRIKGYPTQSKSFKRLTDARRWGEETEAKIRAGEFSSITPEARRKTVSDVITRYKVEVLPNKAASTQRAESTYLKFWNEQVGEYALALLKPEKISDVLVDVSKSKDGRSNGKSGKTTKPKSRKTIKHYRDSLELLFKCAIRWGWTSTNPVNGVERVSKIKNDRVRFLEDNERKALLKACKASYSHSLYAFVVFALSTGARKGEIENLKITDIDLNRHVAILRDTKNGDTRPVPLSKHAREVVEEQIQQSKKIYEELENMPSPIRWLFPRADGLKPLDTRKAWEKARTEAKLVDFRFHDLRHSTASYLAMHGANQLEIAEVLGHRTLQMVKRYAHLSESHVKDLMEDMNEKIF